MKIPKTILQAVAVAVTVSTVAACTVAEIIKPKKENTQIDNCPACGLG
jgi:hypothetical protein